MVVRKRKHILPLSKYRQQQIDLLIMPFIFVNIVINAIKFAELFSYWTAPGLKS